MRNKIIVFFIMFVLTLTSYSPKKSINESNVNDRTEAVKVNLLYSNEIKNIDLEEYIIGVVACEMPASFNNEALKAMAVAARTYALYKMKENNKYDLTSTTKDQCYINNDEMKSKWGKNFKKYYKKISNAVSNTSGEYMTYKDKVIESFYFSISNGYTENSENVFSEKLDYLVSVDSSWDSKYSYKKATVKYKISDFFKKLNIKDNSIKKIEINRYPSGRVKTININGKSYKGTTFRKKLSLRSTDFEINYDNDEVTIKTKGYGHGVGMSQYGANAMASLGYTYDEILKYYYKGINLVHN